MLDGPASPDASPAGAWRAEARKRLAEGPAHHPGSAETPDGRLDPRSLATALDAVLPQRRTVVQDGGHFVGWAPMYWNIPRPQDLVMVGTAFLYIAMLVVDPGGIQMRGLLGIGTPSALTGS